MRLTGTCVLVLSVFALAGSAYAGNGGNGNGNGGNAGGASDAASGNSVNAPGQLKKDPPPSADTTTTVATTVAAPSVPASEGVKPSNETAHDTHAEAQSNQTKQYGNGQTAGQIALKNGAAGTTVLHGPGNSQPHKASPCAGGHEVDVHALKGRRSGHCGGGDTPQPTPTPVVPPGGTTPPTITTAEQKQQRDPASADPAAQSGASGATAGQVAAASSDGGDSQGVLASTQRIGRTASLPFTGRPLWQVVLVGLFLIATGLALREIRTAEARVESGHEHTDRAHDPARGSRPSVGGRAGR